MPLIMVLDGERKERKLVAASTCAQVIAMAVTKLGLPEFEYKVCFHLISIVLLSALHTCLNVILLLFLRYLWTQRGKQKEVLLTMMNC